jgi:hypothetical protein
LVDESACDIVSLQNLQTFDETPLVGAIRDVGVDAETYAEEPSDHGLPG